LNRIGSGGDRQARVRHRLDVIADTGCHPEARAAQTTFQGETFMFERIRRGWGIAEASWSVLKLHPKLLLLPILSGVAFVLLIGSIILIGAGGQHTQQFTDLSGSWSWSLRVDQPIAYVTLFAFYLACVFVAIFFNSALVFCALEAFAGRTPSLRGGLATAFGRLPQILGWALVSATVGVLLAAVQQALRDRLGFLGWILGGLLEFAWAVVTCFVVPVLVVDGVGPIEAVKRSWAILKRTWGEAVGGNGGMGIIAFLLLLPALLVLGAAFYVAVSGNLSIVLAALVAVAVLYIVALTVVFGTLGAIFRTGLYIYATTGTAPATFDAAQLQGAFRSKTT
jgi:hypothetical protein